MNTADQAFLDWRARPTRDALRRLLQANQDRVFSLCFQVLRHAQDAEDAAQASLLELARGADRIAEAPAFSSWLYRVCLHNALNLRRERRRRTEREERSAAMAPTSVDLRDSVHEAIAQLDDDDRSLVVEHYFEKATLEDLGARRGVTGVAIWKRIEHAKEKLRRALVGVGIAAGMTQVNSVLEAAEVRPAPSGFSVEGALSRGSLALRIVGAAAVIVAAVLTAFLVMPKSTNGASGVPTSNASTSPAPTPPAEVVAPPMPVIPPLQEEATRVVDPDGNPIQGALVFPGRWYRLRGDDAFDLFRPNSIKDGVKTDAEGKYRLEHKSPFMTAWHDEFTPTTVKASEKTIRMKARGTLKGRLVDAAGMGLEGVEVTLDKRGPKTTTDKEGRFQFEKVIAGFRGLILPDRRRIAVRVDPGETLTVDIGPGVDVALDLGGHPMGAGVKINGGLLGTGLMSTLVGFQGDSPSIDLKAVLPGRYLYFETRQGPRGWVEISEKGAKVEFGASTLEISAGESVAFHLLPPECNEIIEIALTKEPRLKAGPGESVKVSHLLEGEYEIRDLEGVTLERFKVGPGETRIKLKAR